MRHDKAGNWCHIVTIVRATKYVLTREVGRLGPIRFGQVVEYNLGTCFVCQSLAFIIVLFWPVHFHHSLRTFCSA